MGSQRQEVTIIATTRDGQKIRGTSVMTGTQIRKTVARLRQTGHKNIEVR